LRIKRATEGEETEEYFSTVGLGLILNLNPRKQRK